jgi:hypothetical protein
MNDKKILQNSFTLDFENVYHLLEDKHVPKFCSTLYIVFLTSFSGYVLLNSSRTVVNDFDAK